MKMENETLEDWSVEQQHSVAGIPPTSKYNALSDVVRRSMNENRLCSLFCGGKNCKYESTKQWTEEHQAIPGIYSSWITSNILAMARPNTELMEKNDIIKKFKDAGIKSIFNLQMIDEHASCGPGLEPCGFAYNPQDFMVEGVYCYNYPWRDYNVGTMTGIADVVKVMQFALSQGKVAVHCHAGLGRTGVLIACYLIYTSWIDPEIVIHIIRRRRPGSIQTRGQIKCIQDFANFLKPSRIIFSSVLPKCAEFTLAQFLRRQSIAVHGAEGRRLKYLPKIIYVCCERLLQLALCNCNEEEHKKGLFLSSARLSQIVPTHTSLLNTKTSDLSEGSLDSLSTTRARSNGASSSRLRPVVFPSVSCESFMPLSARSLGLNQLDTLDGPSCVHSGRLPRIPVAHSWSGHRTDDDIYLPDVSARSRRGVPASVRVLEAMGSTEYTSEVYTKVELYKHKLNTCRLEWNVLRDVEDDPRVLSALMWDWIDELKEPVVTVQDLQLLLENSSHPSVAVKLLAKGVAQTISYIFHAVASLQPVNDDLRREVIQRVLSTLLHQKMIVELDYVLSSTQDVSKFLQRTSNEGVMKHDIAHRLMDFFERYLNEFQLCPCVDKQTRKSSYNTRVLGKRTKQIDCN